MHKNPNPNNHSDSEGTHPSQLSLWDLASTEQGYRALYDLDFSTAEKSFEDALFGGFIHNNEYTLVIETCHYWNEQQSILIKRGQTQLANLLNFIDAFKNFTFHTSMKMLRLRLLEYIAELLPEAAPSDIDVTIEIFDLLIADGKYHYAKNLIECMAQQWPDNLLIKFAYAEAHWYLGEYHASNLIYLNLLLHQPYNIIISRISNPSLHQLILQYGATQATVYGYIFGIFKMSKLPDSILYQDDQHQCAIECIHHILESENAIKAGDTYKSVSHRKQLYQLSPEITKVYMNYVKKHQL